MILARYMPNSSSSPATVEEASAIVGELTITFGFWASGFTQSIASNMLTTWMLNNFSVDGGSSPSVDTTTRAGASITTEPKGTDGTNGISHRVRVVPAFKKDTLIALDKESVTGISARIVSMAEYKVMEQERRAIIKRYTGLDIPEDDEPVGTPILGTPVSSTEYIYLPIANGDASTEFSSTQTGTTGAKFNQTMVMAVAFKEADPSLKVTSTIFDYQNATGTALEATDVSTSDTVQAGHGMRSVISSSTECWSPMPR